jgi:predicted deacetylase
MQATYIFRMDDITPSMDWNRFWALMQLFRRHDIKPLLGVVPDNRDYNLTRCQPHPRFWDTLRELKDSGAVDIAQHGYQHILVHRPKASLLGPSVGIRKEVSEFAGDTYNDQSFRIAEGKRILDRHGLSTSYWMAPNHSYDENTLKALRDNGFTAVSDGVALFPYRSHGLLFVPQTSWKPRWMPLGVHTICLHTNTITPSHIKQLRIFLRRPFSFTRFSEATSSEEHVFPQSLANQVYAAAYKTLWAMKNISRSIQASRPHRAGRSLPGKALRSEPALPQP